MFDKRSSELSPPFVKTSERKTTNTIDDNNGIKRINKIKDMYFLPEPDKITVIPSNKWWYETWTDKILIIHASGTTLEINVLEIWFST